MNGELPEERVKKEIHFKMDFLTIMVICFTTIIVSAIIMGGC